MPVLPATVPLVSRVDGQRVTLRHVSNRPPPNLCLHVSAHTALQTWSVVCLDRLSPRGSRPPPHGRGHLHNPAALPHVPSITPGIRGRVRGQVLVVQEHQPLPAEPYMQLVTAYGSHGISSDVLFHMGCTPDQKDASRHRCLDESFDGMQYRQGLVFGSVLGGWH
jgi:hypothetical protein